MLIVCVTMRLYAYHFATYSKLMRDDSDAWMSTMVKSAKFSRPPVGSGVIWQCAAGCRSINMELTVFLIIFAHRRVVHRTSSRRYWQALFEINNAGHFTIRGLLP